MSIKRNCSKVAQGITYEIKTMTYRVQEGKNLSEYWF